MGLVVRTLTGPDSVSGCRYQVAELGILYLWHLDDYSCCCSRTARSTLTYVILEWVLEKIMVPVSRARSKNAAFNLFTFRAAFKFLCLWLHGTNFVR